MASWQRWIFCQSLMVDNVSYELSSVWYTLLSMYRTQAKVREMFQFLPCSKTSRNIKRSLYSLSNNFLPSYGHSLDLKESDSVNLLFIIFAKHSKNFESLMSILFGIDTYIKR